MKTIKFIAAAVICLLSLTANAQSMMRIELEDGKHVDYQVSSITSIKWFTNEIPDKSPVGAQAVDLGLSVKWANMNIGATSMDDYGDYFAWGETVGYKSGKKMFTRSTYKYYMSITTPEATDKDGFTIPGTSKTTSGFTKYVMKSDASKYGYDGFYDNKTVLDFEDDAAIANWGGTWRMPTTAEQDELRTKCKWEWKELNGKKGYKVTGPNGNFIFLPAAGSLIGDHVFDAGSKGYYLSSSLNTSDSQNANDLSVNSSDVTSNQYNRSSGASVRAVCPK